MQISMSREHEKPTPSPSLMPDDACPLCGWWSCKCGQGRHLARIVIPSPPVGITPFGAAWMCNICASTPGTAPALCQAATDSDPDIDEALRRARGGK